jgi:hypothetical protein
MVLEGIGKFFTTIFWFILALFGKQPPATNRCDANGSISPTSANTLMRFVALGDTPYDAASPSPLHMGAQYACVQNTMIPGLLRDLSMPTTRFDFVVHVGDVKAKQSACTDALFDNRLELFTALEAEVDFLLIPGGARNTACGVLLLLWWRCRCTVWREMDCWRGPCAMTRCLENNDGTWATVELLID